MISLVAGTAGAIAMYIAMRIINLAGWAEGDMILAVGSLATKRRDNAFAVGIAIHLSTAVVFAFLYMLALSSLGFVKFPGAMISGAFFGVFHGIFVSLGLVWVASDQHPLEEFRGATLPIGVMHFVGHVVFGGVVGLVISLSPVH